MAQRAWREVLSMSIYVILDIKVHDPEKYLEYQRQAPAIIEQHGGRYLVRGGDIITLGSWQPERIVMLEFPTAEQAQAMLLSPEYQQLKLIRDQATTSHAIAVEGCTEDFPAL
jgi:uncharacterized protein (DUF1330 family)